ncbi:AzlC family ABC transporter permease [Paracoccus aminophilus]|uniref:AzlC family protein n=1 Tax=Paracoccus aminophilus JCM 7686 TaxID=1367847 RepID=S5XUQ3_PARAH|nr:AzlC family ABC transporter permease [Paracoccus aminophilus]AGT11234.1 AzlC family protein [Paracoccus aminophilus JCM 7686]
MSSIDPTLDTIPPSPVLRGIKDALPMMLGFVPFAFVLGAQAAQKGLSPVEVPMLTGFNFAGGSEFAAVALWSSPPHLLLIVAVTLLINSRHLLMGAAMVPFFKGQPLRKVLPALFFLCDEVWALALAEGRRTGRVDLRYYAGAAGSLYLTWVSCTAIGALIGPVLGDITRFGFDMAFPAVFLVMLAGMWKGARAAFPWLVALIAAVLACIFLPGAWYVPAGTLAGLLTAYLMARPE